MIKEEKEIGYIIPHTHWDREWRYPLWKNRVLLVEFMEQLLDILDNDPEYKCFVMDGQCATIEDYLEVEPDKRDKVCGYIKDGRIAVGPWYTLPDLYPVDGECLARNLLMGMRKSEELGGYLNVGYNTFGWGQTAQFPQIYKEFGIDFIICAKKVSEERAPESEFLWEAPDGTRILTSRLGVHARANFYVTTYMSARYGIDCLSNDYKYSPGLCGLATHKANSEDCDEDFFLIEPRKEYFPERLKEGMKEAWKNTDATIMKSHRLFLNGTDFSTPQPLLSTMIKDLNNDFPDKHFENVRLEVYGEKLKEYAAGKELRVIKGELRDGPACDCSGNALASRIYIKQLNKKVQALLLHQTEPLAAISSILKCSYPKSFLDLAWKYLLQSHPHDSINGVTQDKTANDVVDRLEQSLEISQVILEKSTNEIIKKIDLSRYTDKDTILVVFNALPSPVRQVIKVCVDTPQDQNLWNFCAMDSDGNKLDVQEGERYEKVSPVHDLDGRPWPYYTDRHIVYIDSGEIPACGYKVIKIIPGKQFKRNHFYWMEMRKSIGMDICCSDHVLENEFLRAEIESNGTITLIDKGMGVTYEKLHYFEDTGDVGNYWAYYPPYKNKTFTSLANCAEIWLEENGPLSATIGIKYKMELPAFSNEPMYGVRGESSRSQEKRTVNITSWITLKRNSKRLDIKTKVENNVMNHRLRVAFPTGIKAENACSSGHFTVDKRPRVPVKNTEGTYWPEMQTLPMQNFVDVSDGNKGLCFINKGLTEYEYKNDDDSTVYLTLFRSMGNMIVTWWECVGVFPKQNGSQMLQDLEFEYSIYPHHGDWEEANSYKEAEMFNTPLYPVQVSKNNQGNLPEKLSFFSIEPENLILSAFKRSEARESYIIRVFNPTAETLSGILRFHVPLTKVYRTNMKEERQDELNVNADNSISVSVPQNKIMTIEIETCLEKV